MALIHDQPTRAALKRRLAELKPDAHRAWGSMTIDQMVHHMNLAMENALGRNTVKAVKFPLPAGVMKFIILNMPWPKGSPTTPEWKATGERFDFETERAHCLLLIDQLAARPVAGEWPVHANFGKVGGDYYSRLHAKHLDHHLKQFSA